MAQGLKVGETVSLIKRMRVSHDDPAYAQGLKQLKAGQTGQVVVIGPGRSAVIEFNGKRITLPSRRLERVQTHPEVAEVTTTGPHQESASTETVVDSSAQSLPAMSREEPPTSPIERGISTEGAQPEISKKRRGRPPKQSSIPQESVLKIANQEELPTPEAQVLLSTAQEQNLPALDDVLYSAIKYEDPLFITAVANKLLLNARDPETLLIQIRLRDLPSTVSNQVDALIQAKLALGPIRDDLHPTAVSEPKRRGRKPKQR